MNYHKETLEKNPMYYSNKKNKLPRNKFSQGYKRPYLEIYRTLKKEIEEDTNKWKQMPC